MGAVWCGVEGVMRPQLRTEGKGRESEARNTYIHKSMQRVCLDRVINEPNDVASVAMRIDAKYRKNLPRAHLRSWPRVMPLLLTPVSL